MAMADSAFITDGYRAERARLHQLRLSIENGLQAMVDLLDLIDPDPDLEPSLAAPEGALPYRATSQEHWADGTCDDGEYAVDDEGEEEAEDVTREDDEPSLGSLSSCLMQGSQENWAGGNRDDREDGHDGSEPDTDAEPDADGEPSCGATHDPDQQVAWASTTCSGSGMDTGIGDEDALAELQGEIALANVPYDAEKSAALRAASRKALDDLDRMTGKAPRFRPHGSRGNLRGPILVLGPDGKVTGMERV